MSPREVFNKSFNAVWMDYLKPGYCISTFAQGPLLHSHFGLTGLFTLYGNAFDMNKYVNYLPTSTAYYNNSVKTDQTGYGSFGQFTGQLGGYAQLQCHKFKFELRLLGGIELLTLPNAAIDVVVPPPMQSSFTETFIYKTSTGLCADGGLMAWYTVCPKIEILFSIDALLATAPYTDTDYKQFNYFGGLTRDAVYNYTAQVFTLNMALGTCYKLGK